MTRRLTGRTVVLNPHTGGTTFLEAGQALPDWAGGLVGEHLLDGDPEVHLPPRREAPPSPAGNASNEEWRAYATAIGIEPAAVAELGREEIKALIDERQKAAAGGTQ